MLLGFTMKAQDYTLEFYAGDFMYGTPLDSVQITNVTQNTTLTIGGSDVLNLRGVVGVENPKNEQNFTLYPNPSTDETRVVFTMPNSGRAIAEVFDLTGKRLALFEQHLSSGLQTFMLKNFGKGVFVFSLTVEETSFSQKFVSNGTKAGSAEISLISSEQTNSEQLKSQKEIIQMQYNEGDALKFVGYSGRFISQVNEVSDFVTAQTISLAFQFYNGDYYISGDTSPLSHFGTFGKMKQTYNEFDQSLRTGFNELMLPISADAAGFQIVTMINGNLQYLNIVTSEQVILAGENSQIHGNVTMGTFSFSSEPTTVFTVPSDGLYNIVIDETTQKFAIVPVSYFGVIGGAVASGWGSDMQLETLTPFNFERWDFELTDVIFNDDTFKFRYSNGWKVILQDGTNGDGLSINTNFGGDIEGVLPDLSPQLIPGGQDFAITEQQVGVYTVRITWTLEGGLVATMTKTADYVVPFPEKLYIIGDAVTAGCTWDWNSSTDYVEMQAIGSGVYQITTELIQNGRIFIAGQAYWNPIAYNYNYFSSIDNVFVDSSNIEFIGTTGNYTVTVDLNTKTVTAIAAK